MLANLFSFVKKSYICIDIGFRNIKIAEVEIRKNGDVYLKNFGIIPTPRGCIKNGSISNVEDIKNKIRVVIDEIGINAKDAKIVMSGTNIITRIFMVEIQPGQELDAIINSAIIDRMPIKLDTYKTDYKVLEHVEINGVPNMKVFVTAVKKSIIESYINVLVGLGLKPVAIDIPANSIGKFFSRRIKSSRKSFLNFDSLNKPKNKKETIAVLDFGSETTIVNIIRNRVIEFNRVILIGSSNIDFSISKTFDIALEKAESYKKMYGTKLGTSTSDEFQLKLHDATMQEVDKIIFNVKTCFKFYEERCCGAKVDKVFMIGGGSMLIGLDELLEAELKLPVYHTGLLDIDGIRVDKNLNIEKFNFLINSVGIALD